MSAVLEVEKATKSYGSQPALRGAQLTLRRGEWLGLLGPNGAGKTTLVRAISGRVRLDQGRVRLLGEDVTSADPKCARHRLGVVPQEVALYPLLTARENLSAFGELQGLSGAELGSRVERTLEWTGLHERAQEPVEGFSGGMKRRLNIGCSVLHRPDVLLLDEPTVGVDPQSRERIWEMLETLRSAGTSLLLTTHQLEEAEQVCERVIIIDHGRAIADGTLQELVQQTVGDHRRVHLRLAQPAPDDARLPGTLSDDRTEIEVAVEHVAHELPGILDRIRQSRLEVEDLDVKPPSLHAVFLHLTGRELRE